MSVLRPQNARSSSNEDGLVVEPDHTGDNAQHRRANLFDAVAGRVSVRNSNPENPPKKIKNELSSREHVAIYPEEVLFRAGAAPDRWHEADFYWADRTLVSPQALPDSDLLKGIHAYAADYYTRAIRGGGQRDFQSMNETALLAVGVLLEEAAERTLGGSGDLALVEGAAAGPRAKKPQNVGESTDTPGHRSSSQGSVEAYSRKRRKMDA